MKYLLIALLFFCHNGFGQTIGEIREYDSTIIWLRGARPELIKCKHIYVAVEPDTVFESHDASGGPSYGFGPRPTGKKILCVKCHVITAQMITSKYPSGRSKVVSVDSVKMWLGYSPIRSDEGYKLFWHPGLQRGHTCSGWHVANGVYYKCNLLK